MEDRITAVLTDECLNATFEDDTMGVAMGEVVTLEQKDYNKLNNKPQINGVTLQGDKTAEELGLVPIVLSPFRAVEQPTTSFRQTANIFVNDGANGFRMTLQQVKDMSTKIVAVKDVNEVDFSKLNKDDYVYTEN